MLLEGSGGASGCPETKRPHLISPANSDFPLEKKNEEAGLILREVLNLLGKAQFCSVPSDLIRVGNKNIIRNL